MHGGGLRLTPVLGSCRDPDRCPQPPPQLAASSSASSAMLFHSLSGSEMHGVIDEMDRRAKSEAPAISSAIDRGETETVGGERVRDASPEMSRPARTALPRPARPGPAPGSAARGLFSPGEAGRGPALALILSESEREREGERERDLEARRQGSRKKFFGWDYAESTLPFSAARAGSVLPSPPRRSPRPGVVRQRWDRSRSCECPACAVPSPPRQPDAALRRPPADSCPGRAGPAARRPSGVQPQRQAPVRQRQGAQRCSQLIYICTQPNYIQRTLQERRKMNT
uniref:Uncharacterized protein n=1 Tax=Crocodylus porosus TaxID=8502 RepID=A0A7M4ESJ6_CROPO